MNERDPTMLNEETGGESLWRHPAAPWLVGLGLLAAFSPVVLDLARHMSDHAWACASLVFPWLTWVAVDVDRRLPVDESKRLIWASVLFGMVLALLAVGGDAMRLGRIGLLISAIGIARGAGWASTPVALLLVWAIPLPNLLVRLLSPGLEGVWGRLAAMLVPGVGFDSAAEVPALVVGHTELVLVPADGGLALGFALAGLGWFRSVTKGATAREMIGRSVLWGAALAPIQLLVVVGASGALVAGARASRARAILDESGWILIFAAGVVLALQALRGAAGRETEPGAC